MQQLIEKAANAESNKVKARKNAANALVEFYEKVGWHVSIQWT